MVRKLEEQKYCSHSRRWKAGGGELCKRRQDDDTEPSESATFPPAVDQLPLPGSLTWSSVPRIQDWRPYKKTGGAAVLVQNVQPGSSGKN